MEDIGKLMISLGVVITIIGIFLALGGKIPFIGRLPGDIIIKNDSISCILPLASSILLSIGLTLLINIFLRLFK